MKLAIAIITLATVRIAQADCGGGSGMTLNLGSDSSSSSSESSCHDTSDVVGYRQCTKYGAWGKTMKMPLVIFELGLSMQRFDNPLRDGHGTFNHEGEDFAYRVVTPPSGAATPDSAMALVTNLRVGVGSRMGLYTAGEIEIGGLVKDPARMEMTSSGMYGSPELETSSSVAFGGLAVVGYQLGSRNLLLGAELAGGFRAVSYQYHSQYLSCEQTSSILTGRGVLEARARASLFVTPVISVGAQAGTSLVDERDWSAGVFLGGYTRSFAR